MAITIGQRIKDLRVKKKLTQDALGAKVLPPLGREHVSHYENGRQVPSSVVQERLAKALGITLSELLKGVTFLDPETRKSAA